MKYCLGDLRFCQPCSCSGDSEGYCFQQVDAKWSEIGAQAFLQLLLPPSSWQPLSVIWTECKNLALVMKMKGEEFKRNSQSVITLLSHVGQ
jgi:hypothetical protein